MQVKNSLKQMSPLYFPNNNAYIDLIYLIELHDEVLILGSKSKSCKLK